MPVPSFDAETRDLERFSVSLAKKREHRRSEKLKEIVI